MPVPTSRLEPEMVIGLKMVAIRAEQTHTQEYGPNEHMSPVKTGGHKESGRINTVSKREMRVRVLVRLNPGECRTKQNSQPQAENEMFSLTFTKGMMSPCHRSTRSEKN